ncbi:MAG: sulfatase-like hydrolase/transferase [Acidobacteriota bacterium]
MYPHWALHVLTLWSLAVAQPVLDLLARNAEFFVVRGSGAAEVLGLVLGLVVVLPLPLVVLGCVVHRLAGRLASRAGRLLDVLVHSAVLAALAATLALLTLTRSGLLDGKRWLVAGLAVGVAFAWAYWRFAGLRQLTTYLSIALIAVPAAFLFNPRIVKVVFAGTSAELHETGAETPVVFVLFDELALMPLLDADRQIDLESFPNLAAFASQATWFANATAVSDATELAVPAILTGNTPDPERLPILRDHPHNLFTVLGGDYRLWALEPITQLCPPDINRALASDSAPAATWRPLAADLWVVYRHLLLAPSYAARLPVISDRWQAFGAPATPQLSNFTQAALGALRRDRQKDLGRFVDAFDPEADAALYFLHVLLPHVPWEYLPSGKTYSTLTDRIPGLDSERWHDNEVFAEQAYRRYVLQTQFLDRWLGQLMARLRQLELYERSLIVLVADHGVSFRPGDSRRLLTETNMHDLLSVPLLIKAPHQSQGRREEGRVTTLDVLPSILDLLDIEPPWPMTGRSAFSEPEPVDARPVAGKYRSLELDQSFDSAKFATLDWQLETFGAPGDSDHFWRAGTYPELYGRKLAEIGWQEQETVRADMAGQTLFDHYDRAGTYSPTFITGILETTATDEACCDLAVAVNGTIRATVRTFGKSPGPLQFAALVPEDAFRQGSNQVDLLRVRGGGPRPNLERLASSGGPSYALVQDAVGQTSGVEHRGRNLPITPSALSGFVEGVEVGGKVRISGWAADVEAEAAPEAVLVFYRGELVYRGLTTGSRDDINQAQGLPLSVRTTFQFEVPGSRIPDVARFGLRLFAVSSSAAAELGFFHGLVTDDEGEITSIRWTNGKAIPIGADALVGHLDGLERQHDEVVVRGWAADVEHRQPPERILVVGHGKLLLDSAAFGERQDVAASYRIPEIAESGFEVRVAIGEMPIDALRVYAVSRRGEAILLR